MSFPRYPKYKDSGVEWLGEVPTNWDVGQSRRLFALRNEKAREGDDQLTASQEHGIILQDEFMRLEGRRVVDVIRGADILKHVEPNDFVISMRSFQGGIEWSKLRGCISSAYVMLVPSEKVYPPYFSYLLKSRSYIQALQATSNLVRDGQALRYSNFTQVDLPLVPYTEQTLIASFLDQETAKIDALIQEQQRLIELLKEKRQAVISHAVTKGLNPNVRMKPSGIEWLGEVPEHWEVGRIKKYFNTCSGGTPNTSNQDLYYTDCAPGVPWVRTTDLSNDIVTGVPVFITARAVNETACAILPIGTVMVAMYGGEGTVGKNGILGIEAAINQAVCGLLPSPTHLCEYTFRFIQFYRPYWMIGAESSRKDPNISQEHVRGAPFLKPPTDEQQAIIAFLELKLDKLDSLVTEAEVAITLLHERRTALISAAVTGKIDVRGVAALRKAA